MGRWSAQAGHLPLFLRPRLLRCLAPSLAALLVTGGCLSALAAPLEGYRLAGTVAVGRGYVGVLELPEGAQVLVREGSEVAGGRVVRLDARVMRLALPEGELELPLQGLPPSAEVSLPEFVTAQRQAGAVAVREVAVGPLREALRQPTRPARPEPTGAGGDGGRGLDPLAQKDPGTKVAERFAPLLGLPPEARIVEGNGRRVEDPAEFIAEVETALDRGMPVGLGVEGVPDLHRIYIIPDRRSRPAVQGVPVSPLTPGAAPVMSH